MRIQTTRQLLVLTFFGSTLIALSGVLSFGQNSDLKNHGILTDRSENYAVIAFPPPEYIAFPCGDGTVKLSLKNGSVEYRDCAPDDAAKAFWAAVTLAYPDVKRAIKETP